MNASFVAFCSVDRTPRCRCGRAMIHVGFLKYLCPAKRWYNFFLHRRKK